MATITKVATYIRQHRGRSAWEQGVSKYALEILKDLKERGYKEVTSEKTALNGASSWKEYSYSAMSLIWYESIAKRLCNKSELARLKLKEGGYRKPNAREEWLDVQARALHQAWRKIQEANRMV